MSKRRRQRAEADLRTMIVKALTGSGTGLLLFFAATAIAALICLKNDTAPEAYGYFELAIGAAAGFVCGYLAVRPIMKKGVIIGTVSTMPMYLVIACVSAFISHGGIGLTGWILGAVMLVAGAAGGMVAVN